MNYSVKSIKSIEELYKDLQNSIVKNGFGLQHTHNIKEKLLSKGVEFDDECLILDICNPHFAKEILSIDFKASSFLPCAISIFFKDNICTVNSIKPTFVLTKINPKLEEVAQKVEDKVVKIINEAI